MDQHIKNHQLYAIHDLSIHWLSQAQLKDRTLRDPLNQGSAKNKTFGDISTTQGTISTAETNNGVSHLFQRASFVLKKSRFRLTIILAPNWIISSAKWLDKSFAQLKAKRLKLIPFSNSPINGTPKTVQNQAIIFFQPKFLISLY